MNYKEEKVRFAGIKVRELKRLEDQLKQKNEEEGEKDEKKDNQKEKCV